MKRLKLILLLTLITLSVPNLFASFPEVNSDGVTIYYNLTYIDGTKIKVVSPPSGKYEGLIRIPNEVRYENPTTGASAILPVVEIGASAFELCTNLTGIELPSTLIQISQRACYNCCE